MDIDELSSWIDKYGAFDNSPWINWFDELYCQNCEPIMCCYEDGSKEFPCSWCELNGKCIFFKDLIDVPDSEEIIKMWLESKVKT